MAATSKVAIANMAISHVGAKSRIESFTERSNEARECDIWYEPARLETLEAYDWSFARRRQALALSADAPPDDWAYRYIYPADCVAMRRIVNPVGPLADAVPYEQEANDDATLRTILTDLDDAVALYTFDLRDVNMFSWHFVNTLSRKLAARIAYALTAKQEIADRNEGMWMQMIRTAASRDANEEVARQPRDASWIAGR